MKNSGANIFLTGVSCVGKSTVGPLLAEQVGGNFFDLDAETQKYYGKPISHIQDQYVSGYDFRVDVATVLKHLISKERGRLVVALPPYGLRDALLRVIKKTEGITVVLTDKPENILVRLQFYDRESKPIDSPINEKNRSRYLKEIRKDIVFYRKSYKRADIVADISGLGPRSSAKNISELVRDAPDKLKIQLTQVFNVDSFGNILFLFQPHTDDD